MTNPASNLPDIAITPELWQIVATILQKHLPDKVVWTFNSRATHTEKPYSYLDLAIISDSGLTLSLLPQLNIISLNRIYRLRWMWLIGRRLVLRFAGLLKGTERELSKDQSR
jgi:transcription elongation factor GreA-like protein